MNFKIIVVALALLVGFTQCKSSQGASGKVNQKKPESVAIAFLKHFSKLDFKKAKALCTEDAQQLMNFMESMIGQISDAEKSEIQSKADEALGSLKSAECKVSGDEAKCNICCDPETGEASDDEPITLKKIDGKWFVHMSKEDIQGSGL